MINFNGQQASGTTATTADDLAAKIVDNCIVVMSSPRMPAADRSLGERRVDGARVEDVRLIVFDDELLKQLASLKTKWRRLLAKYGQPIRAFGANLVPIDRWEQCLKELQAIQEDWNQAVETAVSGLADSAKNQCNRFPHQAASIMAQVPSQQSFRASCQLLFTAFKVRPEDVVARESLLAELDSMEFNVLDEIAKMVIDSKRDKANASDKGGVDYLNMLANKAKSFGFVGQRVARAAMQMEQVLMQVRGSDKLSTAQQSLLAATFKRLATPDFVLTHGLQVQGEIAAVQALQPTTATAQTPATPAVKPSQPIVVKQKKQPPVAAPAATVPVTTPMLMPSAQPWANNPTCI